MKIRKIWYVPNATINILRTHSFVRSFASRSGINWIDQWKYKKKRKKERRWSACTWRLEVVQWLCPCSSPYFQCPRTFCHWLCRFAAFSWVVYALQPFTLFAANLFFLLLLLFRLYFYSLWCSVLRSWAHYICWAIIIIIIHVFNWFFFLLLVLHSFCVWFSQRVWTNQRTQTSQSSMPAALQLYGTFIIFIIFSDSSGSIDIFHWVFCFYYYYYHLLFVFSVRNSKFPRLTK